MVSLIIINYGFGELSFPFLVAAFWTSIVSRLATLFVSNFQSSSPRAVISLSGTGAVYNEKMKSVVL